MVHDGVPWEINILSEAAPQVRRLFRRGISVADSFRVMSPIRVFTVTILTHMTPIAFAAHDIVLDKDQVALSKPLTPRELAARAFDPADVFMPHDDGGVGGRLLVELHIRAADTGNFHFQQCAVFRSVRHRKLADLGLARACSDGC